MAIAPSAGRPLRFASWAWDRRRGALAKAIAILSSAGLVLLAFYPLGWHHHVRFIRYVHEHIGGELRAHALLEFDLTLPPFHPRVYDVDKLDPAELARRIDEGTAREWLVTDAPILHTGAASLDARARLVWSELPVYGDPELTRTSMRFVEAYNARARPPLRPLHFGACIASSAEVGQGFGAALAEAAEVADSAWKSRRPTRTCSSRPTR